MNRFLQRLDQPDLEALQPLLRRVSTTAGQIVIEQGAEVLDIHFPINAQFTNQTRFADGSGIETAVVGCEGVTGLAPFMAATPCAWEVVARTSGEAWAAEAARVRQLSAEHPSLMKALLRLTDFYQAQAAQTAACNATHQTLPRVARWLLVAHDLATGDRVFFTQEELARLLGAQRTTINEAAHQLKSRKLITYSRGVVRVLDRAGLEAAACECHENLLQRMMAIGIAPKSEHSST
jgi:CRP-like cAMP-binding protein